MLERSSPQGRSAPAHPGTLRVLAAHDVPIDPSNPEALTRGLGELRETLRISTPIVLGLPGSAAILATLQPLIPTPRRAELAVQFELLQQLPFALEDVVWHYQWLTNGPETQERSGLRAQGSGPLSVARGPQPPAPSPQPRSAVAAAMRRSLLEERLACCRRAGLTVGAVALNPLAALNGWWAGQEDRRPSSAVLLHVMHDQAADWVCWTPTLLQVVPVASTSADGLLQELAGSWQALRAQTVELPTQIWLAGDPTWRQRLERALSPRGQVRVECVQAPSLPGRDAGGRTPEETSLAAFGLALQGLGTVHVSLNLLAGAQREAQSLKRQQAASLVSVCALAATLLLGLGGMLELRQRRVRVLQLLERQERLYQTLRPQIRTALQRQQGLQARIEQCEQLANEMSALAQLLAQTSALLPDEVWLTKLEGAKTVFAGSPRVAVEGLLEGRAKSFQAVTKFLDRLKGMEGMTAVKPLSTNVTTDQTSGKEIVAFAVQIQRQSGAR